MPASSSCCVRGRAFTASLLSTGRETLQQIQGACSSRLELLCASEGIYSRPLTLAACAGKLKLVSCIDIRYLIWVPRGRVMLGLLKRSRETLQQI